MVNYPMLLCYTINRCLFADLQTDKHILIMLLVDIHNNNERGKVLTDVSHFCHTIIFSEVFTDVSICHIMKGKSTYRCFDLYHIFVTHLHGIPFPVCAVTIYMERFLDCLISYK